jgi:hypothetical protein
MQAESSTGRSLPVVGPAALGLLALSGGGLALMTEDGSRHVVHVSDPVMGHLEDLQLDLGEGPSVDAFAGRLPVLEPDTLVTGFDVVEFLHRLTERSVEVLDVSAAGLMLSDQRGSLRVVASSDERTRLLELFELQNEEGPCLDCSLSGEPVLNHALDANGGRWPLFGPEARAPGFHSAHALPCACGSTPSVP